MLCLILYSCSHLALCRVCLDQLVGHLQGFNYFIINRQLAMSPDLLLVFADSNIRCPFWSVHQQDADITAVLILSHDFTGETINPGTFGSVTS